MSWKATTRRWLMRALKISAVAFVAGGIIYWINFAPMPATSYTVQRGTIVAEVMGTGTLEARIETTMSPKVSGRVVEVLVDQGSRVSAGDLLVRLDEEELKQQVAIAQANIEVASAAILRLTTEKSRAAAVYEHARKDRERMQSLVTSSAVSQSVADKATEALAIAEAGGVRAAAAIEEGRKALVSAETNLEYHRTRLRDTEIRSPFDGLIVRRSRDPGDVVVPGTPILTLIATDEMWIRAWVDETEMTRLKTGQSARVVFRSEPDRSFSGTVARLGRETDRETREFIVDVLVLEIPTNWAVGQRAEAFIETDHRQDVVTLPADRLINHDGTQGAFLHSPEGSASWRTVRLGLRNRQTVEVLEGLEAGDVIIAPTNSARTLTNGRKVSIRGLARESVVEVDNDRQSPDVIVYERTVE